MALIRAHTKKETFRFKSTSVVPTYDPRAWESVGGVERKDWQMITAGLVDGCVELMTTSGVVGRTDKG